MVRKLQKSVPLVIALAALIIAQIACDESGGGQHTVKETASGDWIRVYFTSPRYPDNDSYHYGGLDEELAAVIGYAESSVDVVAYDFDLESVTNALIAAHQRGVKVRFVIESDNADEDAIGQLQQAGIPVVEDDPVSQTHLDTAWRKLVGMNEERPCWIHSLTFVVDYDAHGLLSINFRSEAAGAYLSTRRLSVNLKRRGGVLSWRELFRAEAVPQIIALVDAQMQKSVTEARQYVHGHEPDAVEFFEHSLPAEPYFAAADLERFALHRDGVSFHYGFGFPHAIQALAPSGRYFLSTAQLLPYLDPDGPLRHWVRPRSRRNPLLVPTGAPEP